MVHCHSKDVDEIKIVRKAKEHVQSNNDSEHMHTSDHPSYLDTFTATPCTRPEMSRIPHVIDDRPLGFCVQTSLRTQKHARFTTTN